MIGPFSYIELLMWWAFGIPWFFAARFMMSRSCYSITYGTILGAVFVAWVWPATAIISIIAFCVEAVEGNIAFLNKPVLNPCKYFHEWKIRRENRRT